MIKVQQILSYEQLKNDHGFDRPFIDKQMLFSDYIEKIKNGIGMLGVYVGRTCAESPTMFQKDSWDSGKRYLYMAEIECDCKSPVEQLEEKVREVTIEEVKAKYISMHPFLVDFANGVLTVEHKFTAKHYDEVDISKWFGEKVVVKND